MDNSAFDSSFAMLPLIAIDPSSGAFNDCNDPQNLAMGVRAKEQITMFVILKEYLY